jgi:branched-chain amino acid transport system ATP-binding protein
VTTALLEAREITAGYVGNTVLHEVSFKIDPGETVLLLGPNGHGKTTFALAITGALPIRSGELLLDGRPLGTLSRDEMIAAGVVHIPQGDALFPEMSVEENLLTAAAYRRDGWKRRKRKLAEVLELFPSLASRRGQDANSLSGGERRMVALGRGLMTDARLLVIDEPSLGLAPIVIDEVHTKIKQICEHGQAVLVIDESTSHTDLAHRVCIMQTGEIVADLPAADFAAQDDLVETYFVGLTK